MSHRSTRPAAFAILLLLAVMLGLLTACGGEKDTGTDGYVSGDGAVRTVDPGERVALKPLTGTGLDGKPVTSADYAGKILVVNLWGSWCNPCRREAPVLAEVSKKLADQNVQFLGLLWQDNPPAALAFTTKHGIDYPSIVDSDGSQQLKFAASMPSRSVPTTWIVDTNGKVAAEFLGEIKSAKRLEGLIAYVKKTS